MDVLGSASFVLQDEGLAQNRLATDVDALASGLRVRSAADDPSGYAVAETIQSKVAGLSQATANVQAANNLLAVADGALSNVQLILQRINALAVEANSGLNSESDLANVQSEIDQLLLEVNRISAETNFNGVTLFNGQFDDGSSGITSATPTITEIQSPLLSSDGSLGSNQVSDSQITTLGDPTSPGPGPFVEPYHLTMSQSVPALLVFQVVSYSSNAVDPDTGINVGPGVYVEFQAYSQDPNMGASPLYTDISAIPVNAGPIIDAQYDAPIAYGGGPPYLLFQFSVSNLTEADVGASAAFITTVGSTASTSGHPLQVNDGGDEGQVLSIDLPEIDTSVLNLSDLSVMTPDTVNYMNEPTGPSTSNVLAASDVQARVSSALTQITTVRARVGAQLDSLQTDATNADIAMFNENASQSTIRDADIGHTVTDFTQAQILVSVGNSVLSQTEVSARQLTALLLNSFSKLSD